MAKSHLESGYFLQLQLRRERTITGLLESRADVSAQILPTDLLATLVALVVYQWVGGSIPIRDYSIQLDCTRVFGYNCSISRDISGLFRVHCLCDLVA